MVLTQGFPVAEIFFDFILIIYIFHFQSLHPRGAGFYEPGNCSKPTQKKTVAKDAECNEGPLLQKSWIDINESVNMNSNSSLLQKSSEKQKNVDGVMPVKAKKKEVATVRPMMKIQPTVRTTQPQNYQNVLDDDDDNVTCVKSVVPSENTEVKSVVGTENSDSNGENDSDETLVKAVVRSEHRLSTDDNGIADGYDSEETQVKVVDWPLPKLSLQTNQVEPVVSERKDSMESSQGTDVDRLVFHNRFDSPVLPRSTSVATPVELGEDPLTTGMDRAGNTSENC